MLPSGVNKGSTLLDVLDQLGHVYERVVAAGDTLNDYSPHWTHKAWPVGNAEVALYGVPSGPRKRYCWQPTRAVRESSRGCVTSATGR